jgi:hypothetical protein
LNILFIAYNLIHYLYLFVNCTVNYWVLSKKRRRRDIIIKKLVFLAIIAFILCTGLALADTGCPQVPETQGFSTSTAMSAIGTVTETDSIVNIIANYAGPAGKFYPDATHLPYPLFYAENTEYTSTYSEDTIADQGLVTYTKGMTTDTSGMATSNLYNVQTSKVVEFIGSDTGRMTSDENSVLDGAGTVFVDLDIFICPFLSSVDNVSPAFCNIVQEGSSVDLTAGSLTTDTAQRYIMKSGGFYTVVEGANETIFDYEQPVSDPGVVSGYNIKLTGFGDVPARGSARASLEVHVQEAHLFNQTNPVDPLTLNPKGEDLVYSETTTASGDISLFQKVMDYTSKITAPGEWIYS